MADQFSYYIPTKIYFGKGGLKKLSKRELPGTKALIVTTSGKSVKANGYLDTLIKELGKAGKEYSIYDKISANPHKSEVNEAAAQAVSEGCDFIISLGGGSSMDAGKAIALLAANGGDYWDYVFGGTGGCKPVENKPLPIVVITTTAGTGSEADNVAVITNEDTNEKIGYMHPDLYPTVSIVDPALMTTVPPAFTAYQGFDALFHATECYITNRANLMSDMIALESVRNIAAYLPRAIEDGSDMEARTRVAFANTLSGMVMTLSSNSSAHSLEHAMSAYHPNLPHGAGLIMISTEHYRFLIESHACDDRFIALAKAMGASDASEPSQFIDALTAFEKACGVDGLKMSDYGITPDEFEKITENAYKTMGALFMQDPVQVKPEDCVAILTKSYK